MSRTSTPLLLTFLALLMSCQKVDRIPQGWRPPTISELGNELISEWRKRDTTHFLRASGDFDGDGRIDYAQMLVRHDRSRYAVFVLLSSLSVDTMLLAREIEDSDIAYIGIRRVLPGTYKTAAGKGYNDPDPNAPQEIVLTCDAIDFFMEESSNSYLIWDAQSRTFKEVWISD